MREGVCFRCVNQLTRDFSHMTSPPAPQNNCRNHSVIRYDCNYLMFNLICDGKGVIEKYITCHLQTNLRNLNSLLKLSRTLRTMILTCHGFLKTPIGSSRTWFVSLSTYDHSTMHIIPTCTSSFINLIAQSNTILSVF